ncbi:prepilin peptidase [Emcibacter nanhaiensis]|uniref:Prepilin peptidase n=1 Tax=Emcibacter nanhaiensis TaxID=1505037 RepID=A0A501PQW4_9PROT|nr:A24 family peptidase [Emcibacter nanhaiensis]TPD62635.1 prepilin peptidase [Emcibacter nanhaiensis]
MADVLKWGSVLALAAAGIALLPANLQIWGAVLFVPLMVLSLIDLKTYRLPDYLTLPLAGAGLAFSYLGYPAFPDFLHSLMGAAAGYLFIYMVALSYRKVRGREGIGMGDAKLLAAAGAWAGVLYLPFILLLASVAGLLVVLVSKRGAATLETMMPFGPFLAVGTWLTWVLKLSSILVLSN